MTVQLSTHDVIKRFGGVTALDRVSMDVEAGELVGLIGPNGSGKTTFLNVLSGFYKPDGGRVTFEGRRTDGREPADLAARGIARTFQVTKIFRRISVLDNLLVPGLTDWKTSRKSAAGKAAGILEDLRLTRLVDDPASSLSGGQAKLLEFGRLLMLDPRIILLDEPFSGVHPELKVLMHDAIRDWNRAGKTIILISHDMGSIFDLCRRVIVLGNGAIIADGPPDAVRRADAVIEAYLGEGERPGGG